MKPILFDKNETNFTTNGLGRLDCISCEVVEERNGMYELEAEIPITGAHANEIEMHSIIGVIPHEGSNIQAFYVYKIGKPISGRFRVYGRHISYRLTDIPCMPFSVAASPQAAAQTLEGLKSNAIEACPFNFDTDVTTGNPYIQKTPASIRQRLGGVEGSVIDQFGGEFEWDNWNVRLLKARGRLANVTGISLRYGKNITDLDQEEEIASTVTGVVPFWVDTDGNNLVTLPEHAVYAPTAGSYPYHLTQVLDLSSEFQDKPTVAQLRNTATLYVNKSGFGVPKVSIKVSFVDLWKSEEYKNIAPLEQVKLCDEITVDFEKLGVKAIAKVVKTTYDVLKERYTQIEVGSIRTTLAQAVTDRDKDIDTAFINELTRVNTAISNATAWLTSANGYVVAVKNDDGSWKELFLMNTNDPQTATQGIRFNNNGLGFFNKALHPDGNILTGPYDMAWTLDGRLGDFANKNFWNFITGDFSLSSTSTVGGKTVQQIADEAQAAAEATAAENLATEVRSINSDIEDLQDQIDGNVTTWYYSGTPTLNNLPASQWTTTTDKDNHIGDIYYDSATGYAYRFMKDGNNYIWTKISDSDIEAALSEAQDAWDLADNKRRVFITQPVPPYDIGDLWVQGSSGDIKRCATAKTSTQTYAASDWVLASKYTDDSALTSWINGTYATDKTDLQNQIDGKAETWYQASDPSASWTTAALKAQHEGDLWYRTTDNTTWYYDGTAWVQQNVPTAVFDKIDGKAHIYTSQPTTPYNVGDLWFASTSSEIKVCITARATGSFVSSDWVKRDKYVDSTDISNAVTAYDQGLDQNKVFNKLIGDDTAQGIVLNNGKLYLRGNYLEAGEITIGGSAFANNPTLKIKDTSNRTIVECTKDGLKVYNLNGTDIFHTTSNGITTTKLVATDDCEFGNLKIGKKTIEPFGVPIEVSYIYAEGYKELFWNEWSSLSKTFRKQVYFSPFYDGWTEDNTIIISFVCDDTGSHDNTQVCRITLYKWNGSSWVSQGYRRFNPDGDEIDGKSDDFGPFYKTDSDLYKLSIIVAKETWASNYELDVYTNWQHVLEADPYETVSSFRGSFTGSAQLYSMSVGDMEVKPNGNIAYDDSESSANYSVSPDGFSSASSSTNYTELTALTNPSIKAHYSSSNYIEFSAPTNPKLDIYSSNLRYIKATGSQLRINYDSSQYILINSSTPSLEVNNSSDDYIYLDDTEVTIHSASNTYAKFRGSASLVASRSGTSYSIPWTTSDRRFKEEIEPLDVELSKNLIDATETKKFKYKDTEGKHYGMIAQEAREVLDSLGETDAVLEHCTDEENEMNPRTIDYHEYIPHLINYVKDLRATADRQQAEIDQLKEIVKKLSM